MSAYAEVSVGLSAIDDFSGAGGEELLHDVLENIGSGSLEMFSRLSPVGREYLRELLSAQAGTDHRVTEDSITALYQQDYDSIPPDPNTFLTHSDYCGHVGEFIWDRWKPTFTAVCKPESKVHELILTGAAGIGKTVVAMLVLGYKICRVLHLKDAARFYRMVPGSNIMFGVYAFTKDLAKRTGFHELRDVIIDRSPFFRHVYPRKKYGKETLEWPQKSVMAIVGSSVLHSVGQNLFALSADELNYYAQGERSTDKPFKLVEDVSRRLESRFMDYWGGVPGIAIFISQTKTVNDFLEERIKTSKDKRGVYVVRGKLWDYSPKNYGLLAEQARLNPGLLVPHHADTPCGPVQAFRVYTGSETTDARIIDRVVDNPDGTFNVELEEDDVPDDNIIAVPVNHYYAFRDDLYSALCAQADVPTGGITPFFSWREAIGEMFDEELVHPFTRQVLPCYENQAAKLSDFFDYEAVTRIHMGRRCPVRHPGAPRYIHLDFSQTRDHTGFAMVHPSAHFYDSVDGSDDKAKVGSVSVSKSFEVDFYVALRAGPNSEPIDYHKTRVFIDWLRRIGYWIRYVTSDAYQSSDHLMRMREAGFIAETLSVDRNSKPYVNLRTVVNGGRISAPFPRECVPSKVLSREMALHKTLLFQEITGLEYDVKKDKVDHQERNPDGRRGSKDVADCLAAAVHRGISDEVSPGMDPNHRPLQDAIREKYNKYLAEAPF